ncbi:MAG: hypothetical protein WB992_00790 [Bryobacteraceae bacterium]
MAATRGKRLSRSNLIGKDGELAFARWAFRHQLSANKTETDIGVDFFCQVMSSVPVAGSMEGEGSILGAQVKTVENEEKPRLKPNRIDATDLLRQTQVTCLFGLRLSDESVHFQFLTKEFIDRLLRFLDTGDREFSIAYASMSDDGALFQRLLQKYANPFKQLQLRIHLIKRRVIKAISGADLVVRSSNEGTVCQVYVPSVCSAFTVEPSAREKVRLRALRGGYIDPEEEGVNLHPILVDALEQTQSSALQLIGAGAGKVNVSISWREQQVTEPFSQHSYGTEVSYVHRAGLRLTWNTQPEPAPYGYAHRVESEIFNPSRHVSLEGRPLVFFRLFRAGAVLSIGSACDLPLSSFGENLEHIGLAVDPIPHLCESLGLPISRVALAHLKDEEFSRTTWFLEALLLKNIPVGEMAYGFVIGPAAELPPEQVDKCPISISVPLVINWMDTGIVIWLECDGEARLHEGLICGVRLDQQRSWRIEKTKRFQKSVYPELWIVKEWPAILIGSDASGTQHWILDAANMLPLEAVIREIGPEQ